MTKAAPYYQSVKKDKIPEQLRIHDNIFHIIEHFRGLVKDYERILEDMNNQFLIASDLFPDELLDVSDYWETKYELVRHLEEFDVFVIDHYDLSVETGFNLATIMIYGLVPDYKHIHSSLREGRETRRPEARMMFNNPTEQEIRILHGMDDYFRFRCKFMS